MATRQQQQIFVPFEEILSSLSEVEKDILIASLKKNILHAHGRYFNPEDHDIPTQALPKKSERIEKFEWRDGSVQFDELGRFFLHSGEEQGGYCELEISHHELNKLTFGKRFLREKNGASSRPSPRKGKVNDINGAIDFVLARLYQRKGEYPEAKEVWQFFEDSYVTDNDDWNCDIIDVSADVIRWKSPASPDKEHQMRFSNFKNAVSKSKKRHLLSNR
jgi:hypothetical protein